MSFKVIKPHLALAGGILLLCCAASANSESPPADDAKAGKFWVYVGTYTGGDSQGIYRCEFDAATGKLGEPSLAAETRNPSFLAIHPSKRFLYAVGEFDDMGNAKTGAVSAFGLDPKSGALTPLNQKPSGGAGPCFVTVDATGKNALVANYNGGSVAVLPIQADGLLNAPSAVIKHTGSSVNRQRQNKAYAHSINLDKNNRFALAADLGCDKIFVYRFDPATGTLTPNDPPSVSMPPGFGPRHLAFHPSGKYVYVINELTLAMAAFAYDAEKGTLSPRRIEVTLPPRTSPAGSSTAEVVAHPSGKFLYGSNRGHNSIVVFSIDPNTGGLTVEQHQGEDIKTPRNFNIDPTGSFLIVANQDGDSLVVFRIDQSTGRLSPTGVKVHVPKPVCVKFVPIG
jgi:6-phosphogluconolactonase